MSEQMVLLEFSIYPLGKGESVSPYVARCVEIVESSGLDYQCTAMGTTLEGDIDEVLDVVRRCFDALAVDCNRIECNIKLDYRSGRSGQLQGKIASVEREHIQLVGRARECQAAVNGDQVEVCAWHTCT